VSVIEPHHVVMEARLSGVKREPTDSMRTYYRTDRSWYADSAMANREYTAEIMISQAADDDQGTYGEYAIRFGTFSTVKRRWMRLEVFDDGLRTLVNHADLLIALAQMTKPGDDETIVPTPEEIEAVLQRLGFIDRTQTRARI
jgi:hypothetical protein